MNSIGSVGALTPEPATRDWQALERARVRRTRLAALGMVSIFVLGAADAWFRGTLSILYVIPIVLLAQARALKPLWLTAGLMIVLNYLSLYVKNAWFPHEPGASFFDFRLINRTFVALMILTMSYSLLIWSRWREDQADAELPENFRDQEQDISATIAVMCCVPLVLVIAIIDFYVPANINLAILYPIPLFACAWTGSRKMLWVMFVLLLLLNVVAFETGPPSTVPNINFGLEKNRLLDVIAIVVLSVFLHNRLARRDRKPI